jgi:hypothetical protein
LRGAWRRSSAEDAQLGTIRGVVLGASGEPIAGALVYWGTSGHALAQSVTSGEDGSFAF